MQSSPTTTRNSTVNTSARGHYAPRSFHAGVLRALDVVAEAALKSGPLDEFLSLVLRTVLENTRHVDTLGVFIQDGNGIRLSTGVGRDEEIKDRFSLKFGQGFAGSVAAERVPMASRDAANDPLVRSRALKKRGVRGLYAVPLLADGALLGVFEMGSMAAEEFTEHDILLFGTVATLLQQRLGKEAEQKRGETHVGFASCDITNRKQAEQFVRHVITIVAHDISSPLTAIALCVPLLEGAGIPERITKAAGIIGQSSSQIGRILVDLHEYVGAIVQAPLVVERRLTDLCAVARAVLDDARVAHPERQFRLEGEQATWGNWDGPRLTRALANLVGNAVKYSAKGTPVVVRVSGRDDAGVVDVENVGCSIAQTLLPHIFEPFRDGRLQLGRPGMGLGLFLAREIARAHHGDLEVHSDAGKVVFRMVLHRKPEASD